MPKQQEICNNCVYFTDGKSISGNIRFICAKSGVFVSSPDSYCRNFEKKTNMPKTKCDHDYKNTENGLYCFRCGQYKVMAEKTNMPKQPKALSKESLEYCARKSNEAQRKIMGLPKQQEVIAQSIKVWNEHCKSAIPYDTKWANKFADKLKSYLKQRSYK